MATATTFTLGTPYEPPVASPTRESAPTPYEYYSATNKIPIGRPPQLHSSKTLLPEEPLTKFLETNGTEPLVQYIITHEGGSLKGVVNNPGNIKFAGLPGQT